MVTNSYTTVSSILCEGCFKVGYLMPAHVPQPSQLLIETLTAVSMALHTDEAL